MCFPLLQVTCRAVGIGSYLVRLGQRVIQVENAHVILTGSGALNKVETFLSLSLKLFFGPSVIKKMTETLADNTVSLSQSQHCTLCS